MHNFLFRPVTVIIILFFLSLSALAQFSPAIEDSVLLRYNQLLKLDPFHRELEADNFFNYFSSVLSHENTFEYTFDTLKKIGIIYSPDQRLRILSWNIPVGLSDNLYYAIIQYYSKIDKQYKLVKIKDSVDFGQSYTRVPWNKELYFQIVETRHAGQRYYTLLGFDFHTPLSNRKSVDVITINDFDKLYFCEKLFHYNGKMQNRIEFIYNEKAVMALRYDDDTKMIIFDHLAPSRPSMEGKYEFYGPDFTYDGLKFEKGIWEHYPNINITN